MTILVTGANGLLGGYLVAALQERGDGVRALALPGEDVGWLEERGVVVYSGDIRRPETLGEPMQDVDAVFHLAALMGVWRPLSEYHAVNVTGTENVCRAALNAGVRRLVHISSAIVYRMSGPNAATEDDPLTPLPEPYALTKAEGDRLVQRLIAEEGLPAVIIRPSVFFGPGDRLNFGRIADRIGAGKAIVVGTGGNAVPFVYVTDVVRGLLLALDDDRAVGQAYNIGNDQPLTQQELLGAIAEEIGARPPRIHVPYRLLYSVAWGSERWSAAGNYRFQPLATRHGVTLYGANNRVSNEKARRDLSYEPRVPLRKGIQLTAAWYRRSQRGLPDVRTT